MRATYLLTLAAFCVALTLCSGKPVDRVVPSDTSCQEKYKALGGNGILRSLIPCQNGASAQCCEAGQNLAGFNDKAPLAGCLCNQGLLENLLKATESNPLARAAGIDRKLITGLLQQCSAPFAGGTGGSECPSSQAAVAATTAAAPAAPAAANPAVAAGANPAPPATSPTVFPMPAPPPVPPPATTAMPASNDSSSSPVPSPSTATEPPPPSAYPDDSTPESTPSPASGEASLQHPLFKGAYRVGSGLAALKAAGDNARNTAFERIKQHWGLTGN